MRIHLSLLAVALIAPSTFAQTHQFYDLHPGQTSFTSRGSLGMSSGEIHQGFHQSFFRGLGQDGGSSSGPAKSAFTRLRVVLQDQNCSSIENYKWAVREGDDINGPLFGANNAIYESGALPNHGTSTSNGACAWIITHTPTTPVDMTARVDKFFSIGVRLDAQPGWAGNGTSCHTAFGIAASTQPQAHDSWVTDVSRVPTTTPPLGRSRAEHTWQGVGPAWATVGQPADHPSSYRTWRQEFATTGVLLELGNNGRYGLGGMLPMASTASQPLAYTARVEGGSAFSGSSPVAAVFPLGFLNAPINIGTGADIWCLFGAEIYFFGPAASGTGVSVIPVAPFIPASLKDVGRFPFQAAIANSTDFKVTNAQSIDP